MKNSPPIFESGDLTERLVGIRPFYLNKFLERELYGIRASVRSGKIRKRRRWFSPDDVFGVALVWMLFESGLRPEPIKRALKQIAQTRIADANAAARKLRESDDDYLLILRQPRRPTSQAKQPEQSVRTTSKSQLAGAVSQSSGTALVLPVGSTFAEISERMQQLWSKE